MTNDVDIVTNGAHTFVTEGNPEEPMQTERYNSTYTVIFGDEETTINRRGIKMTLTGERATLLRSQIAHSAEPAAVIDDWWHGLEDRPEVAA